MAAYNKFQNFVQNVFHGVHNFSSDTTCTLTLALTATANPPAATNAVLTDLTEITYTNLSSRVVAVNTSGQTGGTYTLNLTDHVLSASGGAANPFQYIALYDDDPTSPADPLICWFDYGSALTLQDGESLTVDFQANGVGTGNLFTAS